MAVLTLSYYIFIYVMSLVMVLQSLTQTMIMLCEIFTDEPDGGSAAISADFFVDLYSFLAVIDALGEVSYYDGYREGWFCSSIQLIGLFTVFQSLWSVAFCLLNY